MEQTIYVDILIAINLFVNFFLLVVSKKILHKTVKRYRIFLGSFIGSLFSLTIFIQISSSLLNVFIRLFCSVITVLVTFGYHNIKSYLRAYVTFVIITFIFAGVMLGIWFLFTPPGLVYDNGVVYFNISSLTLIIATTISYVIITLVSRLFKKEQLTKNTYDIIIKLFSNEVFVKGIVDTGNTLKDPFSDTPAIVVDYNSIKDLLSDDFKCVFKNFSLENEDFKKMQKSKFYQRFRLLPYEVMGGSGLVPCFMPDQIILINGNQKYVVEDVIIAVTNGNFTSDKYGALINPGLVYV